MRALRPGRRGPGGARRAKPQCVGAFDRLYAENVDCRNHRRLRALSELRRPQIKAGTGIHDFRKIADWWSASNIRSPFAAGTFANVRIKGPPANNGSEWSFGFDIRLSDSRLDAGEYQIHSARIGGTLASAARDRLDADAVPELGFQPDRGQTGASGYSAFAARHDPLHCRPSRAAIDRPLPRREHLRTRRHASRRPVRRRAVRRRIRADLSRAVADLGLARGGLSLHCPLLCRDRLVSIPG